MKNLKNEIKRGIVFMSVGIVVLTSLISATIKKDGSAKELITSTRWQHVKTINAETKKDVTQNYGSFIGIAEYKTDGTYEFFDLKGNPKGDKGTWELTAGDKKMKITSETYKYSAEVEIVKLNKDHFDMKAPQYKDNKYVEDIIAEHIAIKK